MKKIGYSGDVQRDMRNIINAHNELVDNLTPKANPRSSTEDGIRIYRTEDKNAVIEAVVDDVWYQTLMTPVSKQGRNKELNPTLVLRSKTVDHNADGDTISVNGIGILYCDNSGGAITIGGFKRGEVDNQTLFIVPLDNGGNVNIEDQEGVSDVDIYCGGGADIALSGFTFGGGAVLIYNRATDHWHVVSVNDA